MLTILNVNDREASRYMVSQMLRASGFAVIEAPDGGQALVQAAKQPDAVVLDVRLPDIDGYEVCRRLKSEPLTASIPVLLTSAAFVGAEHRVEGLEAGADAYLVQPFESSELSATLHALLRIRTAERSAQRLAAELGEAVRVRDEFLSIASHELKTPLTSLHLQLETLQRALHKLDGADERLHRKMDTALRQTSRLSVLVDDLLDVTRLSTGQLALHREEVELSQLLRDVVARFAAQARRSGCQLELQVPEAVHANLDRSRVEQVVTNLVSNAMKYGACRPVVVRLTADDHAALLEVRDQGIGISEADRQRVFGRFERAVSARHFGGLGLGLYISRQIVQAHGGTIWVESAPEQGSAFRVVLPLQAASVELEPAH